MDFIPASGACLMSRTAAEGAALVRFMVREASQNPADNGWRIISAMDTTKMLDEPDGWKVVDFNDACAIEPALIAIYDFPVGSDLQLARSANGALDIVDTPTGRVIPHSAYFVPPQFRA